MSAITKDNLFKAGSFTAASSPQRTKADVTTAVARGISDAETSAREEKTARLRALRLAKEQEEAEAAAKAPPAPKKKRASTKTTAKTSAKTSQAAKSA